MQECVILAKKHFHSLAEDIFFFSNVVLYVEEPIDFANQINQWKKVLLEIFISFVEIREKRKIRFFFIFKDNYVIKMDRKVCILNESLIVFLFLHEIDKIWIVTIHSTLWNFQ